ncbi:hypothetical protein Hanom_Chr05g00403491 [Helianthus anomalus]
MTDSTTRTIDRPRGTNHRAPTCQPSASTNGHVRGVKPYIPCWRRPTQGPPTHLIFPTHRL